MPTLGHRLATERLRQSLDLQQVSTVTRISPRLLRAIELDDFEQLPGRVFARNFVRQYAHVLSLNEADVLAQFDREQSADEPAADVTRKPKNYSSGFSLNLRALADVFGGNTLTSFFTFVITIGVCAAGVWAFENWGTVRAHVLPSPRKTLVAQVAKSAPPKQPVSKPAETTGPAKQAAVPPPGELDSPAIPASGAGVHVLVAASDSCWTRITADGKVLFTGMLNAGESREINAASVVDLRAGNAGALALKLNGSDIPPLGPKGQIRSVILTVDGAHVRTPTPEPVSEPL
jgi:cytoskeletal protein RodZ